MPQAATTVFEIELSCKKCGTLKPVSQFPRSARARSGQLKVCHACRYGSTYGREPRDSSDGRLCRCCRQRKPFAEFGTDKSLLGGVSRYCKECANSKSLARHHKRHPDDRYLTYKKSELKRKWGLTIDAYHALVSSQGGLCGICRTPLVMRTRQANIDHDHLTGAVRGILCMACNSGLGQFRDNEKFLESAIAYLRRARGTD